jgi:hypothetical protein
MKLATALESGITGAATLTLLREALDHFDPEGSPGSFFQKKGIIRELKKTKDKKGVDAIEAYIKIAAETISLAGYMGLSALGKRKNAILRGGALGGVAGLIAVLINNVSSENDDSVTDKDVLRQKVMTIVLYILGGLIAGGAVKMLKKKKNKKNKK